MNFLPSSSYTASSIVLSPTAVAGPSASRSAPETHSHNNERRNQISYSGSQSGISYSSHHGTPSIKHEDDFRNDALRVAADFEFMFDYGVSTTQNQNWTSCMSLFSNRYRRSTIETKTWKCSSVRGPIHCVVSLSYFLSPHHLPLTCRSRYQAQKHCVSIS